MYLPTLFAMDDVETMHRMIGAFPLGAIITQTADGLTADHIPLLVEPAATGDGHVLVGHVARNNPLWQPEQPGAEVLVIFQGESAYITPNWYATKQATHQVVPTYNYCVVHVHGPLVIHDDPKWTRMAIGKLTKRMEGAEPVPWKMGDAPQDYLREMVTQIVGIEIPIRQMTGKWKTSQNRPEADRAGVVAGLEARNHHFDTAMAALVRKV